MKTKTAVEKSDNSNVGVIVGRFQVHELHAAHKELIQHVRDKHERVLLFLGLSPCKCTLNNPLDFYARKVMIEQAFKDIEVFYIADVGNDELWSKSLDDQIEKIIGPNQTATLYGSRDSFVPHYKGKFPTVELVPSSYISGTELRKNIATKARNEAAFRAGAIWAMMNQYPTIAPTVDIAIIDFSIAGIRLLLARKPTEKLLRFIGGFSTPVCKSYEEDARREVTEESGVEIGGLTYLGSTNVDDWRYRQEQNKIRTILFVANYISGTPSGADDVAEVRWVLWDSLHEEELVEEHRPLLAMLTKYLDNLLDS